MSLTSGNLVFYLYLHPRLFFYLKDHVSFKKEDKPHMVEVVGKYDLKVSGELVFTWLYNFKYYNIYR